MEDKKIENEDWVDYPYLGRGSKPYNNKHNNLSDDELEQLIGG